MGLDQTLQKLPAYVSAKRWYLGLPQRDRQALSLMLVVLALVTLYFGVWKPVQDFKNAAASELESSRELIGWMKANEKQARLVAQQSRQASVGKGNAQSLASSISASAKQNGIVLKRFEPSGDNKIRVWLDKVDFDNIVNWLQLLEQKQNILVEQISVDKAQGGNLVNIKMTLKL